MDYRSTNCCRWWTHIKYNGIIMSIQILAIENKPISSISYIIYHGENSSCIIIDPGSENPDEIDRFIIDKSLKPIYIIFTHEHFDHIWAANYFIDKYDVSIICSEYCAQAILNPKLNLSAFYDTYKAFSIKARKQIIAKEEDVIDWEGIKLLIKEAKGHSLGGIIVLIDKCIFTGDTLIKGIKTVTKLKGASKDKLIESIEYLNTLKGLNYIIYPGHGVNIELDKYDLSVAL